MSSRLRLATYAGLVAIGFLAHLYMGVVVLAHAGWVVRRRRTELRAWTEAVAVGGLLAAPVYLIMLPTMASAAGERVFHGSFPIDAAAELFGSRAVGVVGVGVLVVLALRRPTTRPMVVAIAVVLTSVWLVLQPLNLFARFLVWLVPLMAMVVGSVVGHSRIRLALVALLLLVPLGSTIDRLDRDSGIRDAARVALALQHDGLHVCAVGYIWESFTAYASVPRADPGRPCDAYLLRRGDLGDVPERGLDTAQVIGDPSTCLAADPAAIDSLANVRRPCRG